MNDDVTQAAVAFERLAIEWDGALSDARRANKLFLRMHTLSEQLRQTGDGRKALEDLLTHDNRGVRLNAAATCLLWTPEQARQVLESLISPRGFHTLSAEMTLREFDAGRLKMDW